MSAKRSFGASGRKKRQQDRRRYSKYWKNSRASKVFRTSSQRGKKHSFQKYVDIFRFERKLCFFYHFCVAGICALVVLKLKVHGVRTELDWCARLWHVLFFRVPSHRVIKTLAQNMTRQPEKLHDSEVQLQRTMPGPCWTNRSVEKSWRCRFSTAHCNAYIVCCGTTLCSSCHMFVFDLCIGT